MTEFKWDANRTTAAQLLAEGELGIEGIAEKIGVTRQAIWLWRKIPEFTARVDEIIAELDAGVRRLAICRPERRIDRLNRVWIKMQRVINERAASIEMQHVPGGPTGLMVRNVKGVGKGEDFQLHELYEVDVPLLKELRETEKQAAIELGQWMEKTEVSGLAEIHALMNSYLDPDECTRDSAEPGVVSESGEPDQCGERNHPPVG